MASSSSHSAAAAAAVVPGSAADIAATPYEVSDLSAPVLANTLLRIGVSVMHSSHSVRSKLLSDSGGYLLRKRPVPDQPTLLPFVPDYALSTEFANAQAVQVEDIVARPTGAPGFHFDTVHDFHKAYVSKELSPVDVVTALNAAIAASNALERPLRAVIATQPDSVLEQARASEQRYRDGTPLSPLDGVPVAIKDELDVIGYPTTVGTRVLGKVATTDCASAASLRAAGAIIIGKTNMHEIGIGTTGSNVNHGVCRNPYNLGHHTGGSSSGSGSAVAAGLCPIAIGADGGGSIRIPASLCGVVGLKATWSRISEFGAFPLCPSVGHTGPIASTVRDVALAYALTAGPDKRDEYSTIQPSIHLSNFESDDLTGVKIGVYDRMFDHADEQVVKSCRAMLDVFVSKGATIRPIAIPELEEIKVSHLITILSEMIASMRGNIADSDWHRLSLTTRAPLYLGEMFTATDYQNAQRYRTRAIRTLRRLFEEGGITVIAVPSTAIAAPRINEHALATDELNAQQTGRIMRTSVLANLTGVPGISFPSGYTADGLPIGFQLMGKWYHEHTLLQMARIGEASVTRREPALYYSLLEQARAAKKSATPSSTCE
ncbi:amidase [Capsaspora owczarzaki ATCC 30864]|uniref:Amidase n=1 Tax=Capsaspora owczarzaki (strain ATCC 30864) TaxID=595528 RepID=A0A0D2U0J1_CAPO3|nr:amidase [Capsaspora owczarzaki ATCC 30864]KJE88756.1 amidase [Capsaspora owczarzaki ATCC 30864]|eukprot:XP_004365217.1 amidase [Capsaspora owczarzaki ATCC 30864]